MSEFSHDQLFIVGLVASAVTFAVNYLVKRQGVVINRPTLMGILYAVSFLLAVFFAAPAMPLYPIMSSDPVTNVNAFVAYLGNLMMVLTLIVGIATAIYNIIGKKVMESIANTLVGEADDDRAN